MEAMATSYYQPAFELLDFYRLKNDRQSRIELIYGDLTAIPNEQAVDLLVISAFPNSYVPAAGTLVEAFFKKGLPLGELANDKAVDMRDMLGCWLSKPFSKDRREKFHIDQFLCFEPRTHTDKPWEVVGNIFRCINNFAFDEKVNRIAMPLLAAGNQQAPVQQMLPALLEASAFWLENGLPLDAIQLYLYRKEHIAEAKELFEAWLSTRQSAGRAGAIVKDKPTKGKPGFESAGNDGYDFFVSYSHKQEKAVKLFVDALKQKNASLRIFYDRDEISPGATWLKAISDAIQHTRRFVAVLSPDYRNSQVCWDEFQCAYYMEGRRKQQIIQTLNFIADDEMPPMMAIRSYIDCTEANEEALQNSAVTLLQNLKQ
jgi:hypothetical protein